MEKVESRIKDRFIALGSLELGFDELARERARKQLDRCSPVSSLNTEESELLMFLLSQSVMS